MIGNRSAQNNFIADPGIIAGDSNVRRYDPNTGGVDKNLIRSAPGHDLCIPGNHRNPGRFGRPTHIADDRFKAIHGKSLFDDQAGA